MSNYQMNGHGRTEWDFWALVVKIVIPLLVFGILFLMARNGDIVAIVGLVVIGTALLIVLGGGAVLAIIDKANAREDARFRANVKENLAIAQQAARLQNTQITGLGRQNQNLLRQVGEMDRLAAGPQPVGGLDIDALFTEWEIEAPEGEALGTGGASGPYLPDST